MDLVAMGSLARLAMTLVVLLAPGMAAAQDVGGTPRGDVGPALREKRWGEAAGRAGDPLGVKLVDWVRLQAPGQAGAAEIGAFIAANPDWPWLGLLERRRQEALEKEISDAVLAAECGRAPLSHLPAVLRCADWAAKAKLGEQAAALARQAWARGDFGEAKAEAAFVARWAAALRAEDERARFDFLLPESVISAARQVGRLPQADQALARARLAFRQSGTDIGAALAAVPAAQRDDPLLFLAQAIDLREKEQAQAALALWRERGVAAQAGLDADRLDAFWTERHRFARQLLRQGDAEGAYLLAAGHGALKTERLVDAQFLAGFIALRFLNDPARAEGHFRALAETSQAAITQGRAWYWLGRVAAARGQDPTPFYRRAAAWPVTFYGQLAAAELGEDGAALARRITALSDPKPVRRETGADEPELVRAAVRLAEWGERRRAFAFLIRFDETLREPADRALLARTAFKLDMPEAAVAIARRMGRDGAMLPEAGWPVAVEPPGKPVPRAVGLAVIRQESAFEPTAVSRVGARGLMQLMPATASTVAKKLGETTSPVQLLNDPAHNMRLGTAYLRQMEEQFASLPLAVAAYNAGPHRVNAWLQANGDPRGKESEALLDWIELIPFNETRNYVQRVLENVAVYRARLDGETPGLLSEWRK